MRVYRDRPLTVVKVGGGLAGDRETLDRVCQALGTTAPDQCILVVPGGGPFADAVRDFDNTIGVSEEAAHWMAILAMDQYAHVLAGRIAGAVLVDEPDEIRKTLETGQLPVLAPSRWMRSADVLPHSWNLTSDSIAAFVAGALDAARLILIKPASDVPDLLDPYFASTLPAGMPYAVIGCDKLDQLEVRLTS